MRFIIEKDGKEYNLMGGKGAALSKIGMALDNIPDWFVASYEGFDLAEQKN